MLVSNGVLRHRFEEKQHPGMRLGRHLELDARSLAFLEPEAVAPVKPSEWLPAIPTLDQGQLGSCTGNAGTYALSALVGKNALSALHLDSFGLSTTDAASNEQFAIEVYHDATIADGFPGVYPPQDTGSSGLGVCKALKSRKLIGKYVWATTLMAFAGLLQKGGCIIGVPWYEAWFHPDAMGFIDVPNWQSSGVAGGHEIYVEALESWRASDPTQSIIRFHNSWSDSWGDHGCGRIRLATYVALRQQIDIKQFRA